MNMNRLVEGLEKRVNLFEEADAYEAAKGAGTWGYVPKKEFLNGLLKVAVIEQSADKWEILYCAPLSKGSEKGKKVGKKLMAGTEQEILGYQSLLSEELEGAPDELKGWQVKTRWSGSFEECLKKCVGLVQGAADAVPSSFKKK